MDDVDHVTPPANPVLEAPWTPGRGRQGIGIRMHRMFTDVRSVVSNQELLL
jgi:hypothetical protein